jgi:hypothetical protein
MNEFPPLKTTNREREYLLYRKNQKSAAVYHWLFTGKTFREIDKDIFNLDADYSKGFQSMGGYSLLGLI